MSEKDGYFKAKYTVADGYGTGNQRPQYFRIDPGDIQSDMSDADLQELLDESMQDHFEQHVFPEGDNAEKFIAWAREQLAKRVK